MERTYCIAAPPALALTNLNLKNLVCKRCNHRNISVAVFCGNCGNSLPSLNTNPKLSTCLETYYFIKQRHFNIDSVFKLILLVAIVLVLSSGIVSYRILNDTSVIKVSDLSFTDVATDHPVYFLCEKLLKIHAIGFRSYLKLAPYEPISSEEWNHSVKRVALYLEKKELNLLCLEEHEQVSKGLLLGKFEALGYLDCRLADNVTRISAFICLEKLLLERG